MSIRSLARALAGFGLCAALAAHAAPYTRMVVFGDSLSDSGNNALLLAQLYGGTVPPVVISDNQHYSKLTSTAGTYSNGKVWTQYLAETLGVGLAPSMAGGGNYAYGGAQTGQNGDETPDGFPYSMTTQMGWYVNNPTTVIDPNGLYVVAGGGNNVRVALEALAANPALDPAAVFGATVAGYVADMATMVGTLRGLGAQHVLVLNTPDFGLTPMVRGITPVADAATQLSAAMNTALGQALAPSGAMVFDMFGFLHEAVASNVFDNVTDACGAAVNNCSLDTALFWDAIHPTTLGHAHLAAAVARSIPLPEPDMAALIAVGLFAALGARRRAARQQR